MSAHTHTHRRRRCRRVLASSRSTHAPPSSTRPRAGMVGGMMVFIVCHELLPAAHRYMNNGAQTTAWLISGMIIMAISLVLFVL